MPNWLGTWKYRRELTIDADYIDDDLTHFPVLLKLGSSVGLNSADVTSIFDEVGSNYKRIAITKSDGETQIYAEVERWDSANEVAEIWVSKSDLTIDDTNDTILYFYYDNSQSDNTTYVGDVGSSAGQAVWNSYTKCVYHMKDYTSSSILDSTSNGNTGIKKGANEPQEVSGKVAKGQDFDGTDDYIYATDNSSLNPGTNDFAVMFLINVGSNSDWDGYTTKRGSAGTAIGWEINVGSSGDDIIVYVLSKVTPLHEYEKVFDTNISGTGWHLVTVNFDRDGYITLYLDNQYVDQLSFSSGQSDNITNTEPLRLMRRAVSGTETDGLMDEYRYYIGTVLSSAWIKATYYTINDSLVSWGAEESSGIIKTSFFSFNQALTPFLKTTMFNFNIFNYLSKKLLSVFDIQGLVGAPAKIKAIIKSIKTRFRVKTK